jgi:basic amino acid/polyamine antiporter, APA family
VRRTLGAPVLFAIVYVSVVSVAYFALGAIGARALGLTPLVFLLAAVMFALAAFTYVEGASLHPDRAGATVFARYAFNELVSFVAGWAILLDYVLIVAVAALSATHYLGPIWDPADDGGVEELLLCLVIIGFVAAGNVRGFRAGRAIRVLALVVADIGLQVVLLAIGLVQFLDLELLTATIELGEAPAWDDLLFALGVATVVFIGLESAAGLAGEINVSRRGLRRLVGSVVGVVGIVYVGIAVVAMTAMPVVGNSTALALHNLEAPILGITRRLDPDWLAGAMTYVFAVVATATLVAAANSAMLGLSRLAYSLARNRQIPSALGKLHPTRSTPFVLIALAAVAAAALVWPRDLEFLVGLFAFGALLTLTLAHASLVVLRFREPHARRPYRMPLNVAVRGRSLPVTAVVGALLSALVWVTVVVTHEGARVVGGLWMLGGVVLYVVYRRTEGKPLLRRVMVPEEALRAERAPRAEYGSILVPVTGTPLDDDIMQTAGRLAAGEDELAVGADGGPQIEAIWVFEVPMALPIDAPMSEAQQRRAADALRRAKVVGEEYAGVTVQTARVRARSVGAKIVEEARRRGVQAIVMGAEPPSRVRGGALLGGRAGARADFLGAVTKYVAEKADCQVIITAPPADDEPVAAGG